MSQELIAILAVRATPMGLRLILFVSLRGEMGRMETQLRDNGARGGGVKAQPAPRCKRGAWATE